MTHPDFDAFTQKFRTDALRIVATAHWVWSVRPVHTTLGAGILSLSRYATSFADASTEEVTDLAVMTKTIESTLRGLFAFDKINYLMLMMNDAHVHFHVMPRYATPRTFDGVTFADAGFPALPVLAGEPTEGPLLERIRDALRDRVAHA